MRFAVAIPLLLAACDPMMGGDPWVGTFHGAMRNFDTSVDATVAIQRIGAYDLFVSWPARADQVQCLQATEAESGGAAGPSQLSPTSWSGTIDVAGDHLTGDVMFDVGDLHFTQQIDATRTADDPMPGRCQIVID